MTPEELKQLADLSDEVIKLKAKIIKIRSELLASSLFGENEADENQPTCLGAVSGMLPMYDVEELNEIVKELNSGKLSLFDFVGKVWNKAYILGCIDGSKGNDR